MIAHILTPHGPIYEGEVTGVQMPGTDGGFEVRKDHAPLVSLLDIGKLVVKTLDQGTLVYAISGGFTEVKDNVVTVMAEEAISRDLIDIQGELLQKKDIESALRTLKIDTSEHTRMEADLRKTVNRISIAETDSV